MSLQTPEKIRTFQKKLYLKAKAEPDDRFYLLYDKIYREDILAHAYQLAKANRGAPGVDGVTFERIEAEGLEGVVVWDPGGASREDIPTAAGTSGDDSETWGRREAPGHTDDSGPGGADGYEAGLGTDL
jgi:hypothetical protein